MTIRIFAVLLILSQVLAADVLDKTKTIGKTVVHYKVVLPKDYDSGKAYSGVLAFPGGPQTMSTVERTVARNWRDEAERRGYIVAVPAAPDGVLFFEGGERIFPEFLKQLLSDYKIIDNKFHIAGVSNGGISAFHIAAMYPQYFWSVTGYPGFLEEATPARVSALAKICINMHVGELDTGWQEEMKAEAAKFREKGYTVRFTVEKGQAHQLETFVGEGSARLFNQFEEARRGCGK
jgi:predicted peptidase